MEGHLTREKVGEVVDRMAPGVIERERESLGKKNSGGGLLVGRVGLGPAVGSGKREMGRREKEEAWRSRLGRLGKGKAGPKKERWGWSEDKWKGPASGTKDHGLLIFVLPTFII